MALRLGIVPGPCMKGFNEAQMAGSVAPFRITAKDGRLVADPGSISEVDELLGKLAPAPKVWREVVVEGGPDGIRSRRPVTAHSQGYVYDLWLIERLADRLGA